MHKMYKYKVQFKKLELVFLSIKIKSFNLINNIIKITKKTISTTIIFLKYNHNKTILTILTIFQILSKLKIYYQNKIKITLY